MQGTLPSSAKASAASAAAGGSPTEAEARLAGRRFALRLPFGCLGPQPEAGAGYAYDPPRKTLKVRVRPEAWTDAPWARSLVGTPQTEAIEGFWVRRPWLLAEACPSAAGDQAAVTAEESPAASPETVGLARVFEAGGSRLLRRAGRDFEATERVLDGEAPPGQGGFRLVLEGRIGAAAGGPIRCQADHPDVRPVCLVIVDIDRVAFEDADGRQLAEWRD